MKISKYIYTFGIITCIILSTLTGCGGKESKKQGGLPEKMTRTHGDSLALAARFIGNFEHFLAVTDSLAAIGELSPIRADGYRGVAYFQMGQMDKCIECFRRVVAIENPPAEDFWEYIHAGTNLVIMLNSNRDYDNAMRTALRLIDKLKEVDSPLRAGELQTLYLCLGDTQMMLERHADAAKSYDEAYQWVLRTPNNPTCRPIAACIETLENIAVTNINHRMDEAGVWVDRMDSLVTIYEKEPNAIEKELKALRALVSLHRAQVLQMHGQKAEAARYYDEYTKSDYGKSLEGSINGCEYLVEAHRYDEAADKYTQLDQFIKEWGYEYDLETIGKNLLPKLRANFGRQTLIDRTGLSKERIGAAFAQGSDNASLPAYVRELRLDYAVRLMNEKREFSIEQVSMASGFTSADTFTRNFRAKYGMTPTTYKQTQSEA
ncbi:Tetratricopeptide repeat-containing protein [Prevotellaceae bacterium MN60]|nr:Tetratricopeptide repeat-containing protein [Prevotellaceae bacterium MN60]